WLLLFSIDAFGVTDSGCRLPPPPPAPAASGLPTPAQITPHPPGPKPPFQGSAARPSGRTRPGADPSPFLRWPKGSPASGAPACVRSGFRGSALAWLETGYHAVLFDHRRQQLKQSVPFLAPQR